MTTTPEPPPAHDDESGVGAAAADDRFDRRIAFGVVAALAVVGSVGPFGWHLLSSGSGGFSVASGAAVVGAGHGGAGSNGIAAVVNPAAPTINASPGLAADTSTPVTAATSASASCAAALGNAKSVNGSNASNGTTSSIGGWAIVATPTVNALRIDAATLHSIVIRQDAAAVPTAAKSLCDHVGSVGQLAAMPDTVGATAWQAALSAYVAGATDALAAVNYHPAYFQAAQAQLTQGEQELDALSARITAATK